MNPIVLEPTDHSPRVDFDPNGKLLLEGRSIPEDVITFFKPLIEFVTELKTKNVVFDINLEYFNTATSKRLLELLKHLDANNKIENILVNWHYETDDEDSYEIAEIYEECLNRADFRYREHKESFSLAKEKQTS